MRKKKICFVTGSRAEYGLLELLMKKVNSSSNLKLQVVVTGMHLEEEFGLTYKEIEKQFKIDKKIQMHLKSDTPEGISKSMAHAHIGFGKAFSNLKPDLLVVLGDRYEILISCIDAMIARIPIAHIHGGETTEGLIDEAIRHSITKMSNFHFTATCEYRNRVIQLGEDPKRVFNFGGMGVDIIKNSKIISREDFESLIQFKLNKKNLLVTYHPVTLENNTSEIQFKEILKSVDKLKNTNIIFTKANSDTQGKIINKLIDKYVEINSHKSIKFESMGIDLYFSALKHVDAVVGNSSSGLTEAPSFKIGTINIGDRQKGRINAKSVINCQPNEIEIDMALSKLYSKQFKKILSEVKNPYGSGGATDKIFSIISNTEFSPTLKKKFFDL